MWFCGCRLYSFLLGRPKMIRKEIFDVALPSLDDPDANENPFNLYQAVRIQLSGIVGEALEKVGKDNSFYSLLRHDCGFHWLTQLHPLPRVLFLHISVTAWNIPAALSFWRLIRNSISGEKTFLPNSNWKRCSTIAAREE